MTWRFVIIYKGARYDIPSRHSCAEPAPSEGGAGIHIGLWHTNNDEVY